MNQDLTKGPVAKSMLLFAVPMILGELLQQRYNIADSLKSPLTEVSGLKSYELFVVYRNLSAIAELGAHFWRKPGVNWRKHRQFRINQ